MMAVRYRLAQPRRGVGDRVRCRDADRIETFGAGERFDQFTERFRRQKSRLA
jgi:hypothetical protein